MFILESTYDGAGTIVEQQAMKSDKAASNGQALVFHTDGTLTHTAPSSKPAYISCQTAVAGGENIDCVAVREDQVFVADYVTATTNVPAVGNAYCISTNGLNIDADNKTDSGNSNAPGRVVIISTDTVSKKCRCKFN